ncbi:MAG: winged helix-turn-helix domain-containing tetratricopeptide repeat protein [Chthoniobacterales bacterium]
MKTAPRDEARHSLRYEFGDFRLDRASHQLSRRDGTWVPLTPRVFDTLLFLVKHHDEMLTKERLMAAVWPDAIVEENNLAQNISTLRRLFGDTPQSHRFIVTVPGHGYRFVGPVEKCVGQPGRADPPLARPTLAVLPFRPLVAENSDPALEIGMADTLIARLSHIRGIVVRSLGAVRRYTGLEQEPLRAGREVGAESVLEGSMQKSGDALRVNVRLLKVASGESLWAGTFDEKITDIFSVQNAIAERVVSQLSLQLSGAERQRLTQLDTANADAYQLYLKGRYFWWKTTPEEFLKCRDYFQRAVDADPCYALGYCGLNAYFGYGSAWGMLPPEEGWPRAIKAAAKALELDGSLAQGHSDLGAHQMVFNRDWAAAEIGIKTAIDLNPRSEEVHYLYSFFLITRGRLEEAISEARLALVLDPLSLRIHQHLGFVLHHARRFDEAIERYQQTLLLDSDIASLHEALGDTFEQKGQPEQAIREWRKAMELSGDEELAHLSHTRYESDGFTATMQAVAQKKLARLHQRKEGGNYVPTIEFVRAHLRMDDREKALASLAKAAEERNVFALLLQSDPFYDPLRADPRFASILQRNGLS